MLCMHLIPHQKRQGFLRGPLEAEAATESLMLRLKFPFGSESSESSQEEERASRPAGLGCSDTFLKPRSWVVSFKSFWKCQEIYFSIDFSSLLGVRPEESRTDVRSEAFPFLHLTAGQLICRDAGETSAGLGTLPPWKTSQRTR